MSEVRDPDTGALRVHITGAELGRGEELTIFGGGIEVGSVRPVEFSQGTVQWQLVKDKQDRSGLRHQFYQLVVQPDRTLAEGLSSRYADGIPVKGVELGLHATAQGPLLLVMGHQLDQFEAINRVVLGDPYQAYVLAQDQLDADPSVELDDRSTWSEEVVQAHVAATQLVAEPSGGGQSFRFVWHVPSMARSGNTITAVMDAGDGRILSVFSPDPQTFPAACLRGGRYPVYPSVLQPWLVADLLRHPL
jgi:hypothetical protein